MYDYYEATEQGTVTVEYGSDRVWATKTDGTMRDFGLLGEAYEWLGVTRGA